jgi:hypothetical protein
MNDQVRPNLAEQGQQGDAVPNVDGFMAIAGDLAAKTFCHPARVSIGAEKHGAVVAVDSRYLKAVAREERADLGADQAAGT